MQYATGRYMCYSALRHFFSVDDVATVLKRVYENRVTFHDGDAQVAPGIEVYKIGGHTAGLTIVRVMNRRGWIVLASDAMHYSIGRSQCRERVCNCESISVVAEY